ncbi:MAG: hypothetical protein KC731_37175 [Myxococcales bacterium]|nr:hypothetical protein [Myxococcales bacterium]
MAVALTKRPEASSAELDGNTFTPDVHGWYEIEVSFVSGQVRRLRVLAFEAEAVASLPTENMMRQPINRRLMMRALAAGKGNRPGVVIDGSVNMTRMADLGGALGIRANS